MNDLYITLMIFAYGFYISAISLRLVSNDRQIPAWTWPGLFITFLMAICVLGFGLYSVFALIKQVIGV